jgi:hypothetical protein
MGGRAVRWERHYVKRALTGGKWPIYRVVSALIMAATAVNPMASGTPPASLKRSYTRAVNMGAPLDILGR